MNDLPLVSIIIVNFNGKIQLEKCLNSLKKVNYDQFETILVDNNSTDNSIEFVQKNFPLTKIIKLDKNYGFAKPNNVGAKNAKGKFLLFLNNDTVVTPNFISEMINTVKNDPTIAICQSLLLKPDGKVESSGDFINNLGLAYSSKDLPNSVKEILSARGASMIVRKDSFWELDGFDESYFASFEDVDLGWRAWILGYRVVLVPDSVVYHEGGQTVQEMSSEIKFHGVKNTLILQLTNFEFNLAVKSFFKTPFVFLSKKYFGDSTIKNNELFFSPPSAKIAMKGIWWVLKNFSYVLKKRKHVNSRRKKSTDELIKLGLVQRN